MKCQKGTHTELVGFITVLRMQVCPPGSVRRKCCHDWEEPRVTPKAQSKEMLSPICKDMPLIHGEREGMNGPHIYIVPRSNLISEMKKEIL